MDSPSPKAASALAQAGLATAPEQLDPESRVLLLREVLKGHLHVGRVRSAHAIARKMVRAGALAELAHADLGRACAALAWWMRAAQAYRIAARFAPARRRSLHWGACASALHHAGRHDEALAALDRAIRWSSSTRPLHRAYAALVQLEMGREVDQIDEIESDLEVARAGEGYGRYVLGRLALARGDAARGKRLLREFLKRNVRDPMRRATLSGEIARARAALRSAGGAR
jgi:tetratricopeptide (TPR) repeat protein